MTAHVFKTIDEYISMQPEEVRETLQTLKKVITEEIPGVEEAISYNMPTFKLNGRYVIYFAAWKNHISLYPFSREMETIFQEAKEYDTSGKGTIKFPINKPLPLPLIRRIVAFRLKENIGKNSYKKNA